MSHFFVVLVIGPLLLASCGSSDAPTDTESVATPADGFQEDPFALAALSSDVTSDHRIVAAYTKSAGRVTFVDTNAQKEVWGKHVGDNYEKVFAVPDSDALGLVGSRSFSVVSADQTITFDMDINLRRWRWAREARAVVFQDQAGGPSIAVRHNPQGLWQRQTLDTELEVRAESRPAPLISSDGNTIVELYSDRAAFELHRFDAEALAYKLRVSCSYTAEEIPQVEDFTNIYTGELVGDWLVIGSGPYALAAEMSAMTGCPSPDQWLYNKVVENGPLRRILPISQTSALIASESGELVTINIDAPSDQLSVVRTYDPICALPAGLNIGGDSLIAVTCVTLNEDSAAEQAEINFLNTESGALAYNHQVNLDRLAGIALDRTAMKVFKILDGGLGELVVADLRKNSEHSVAGLFVEDILNKL